MHAFSIDLENTKRYAVVIDVIAKNAVIILMEFSGIRMEVSKKIAEIAMNARLRAFCFFRFFFSSLVNFLRCFTAANAAKRIE